MDDMDLDRSFGPAEHGTDFLVAEPLRHLGQDLALPLRELDPRAEFRQALRDLGRTRTAAGVGLTTG